MKIKFIDSWGNIPKEYYPVPASKHVPEWYRKMPTYTDSDKIIDKRFDPLGTSNGTVKKCMPFFDAMTAGYVIVLPSDVNVRLDDDGSHWFEWSQNEDIVQFHPEVQIPNYPGQESRTQDYPKFFHPWVIKTPPGYSCLFTSPMHQDLPFKTLDGIVDTDRYHDVILFPFVLKDEKFEGLIPAGTPIVQIIPIKRQSWHLEISQLTEKLANIIELTVNKVRSVFNDGYKLFFWERKQYK